MKKISDALQLHLQEPLTYLTTCWKLLRTDNVVMGFTSHNEDIVFDGITYIAQGGFIPSDIENSSRIDSDNLQIEGVLSDNAIKESDIVSGVYDFAKVEIFIVNYKDLDQGTILLKTGTMGKISIVNQRFTVELRGITEKFVQNIGQIYSPSCRAQLGDTKCKVIMSPAYIDSQYITSIESQRAFTSNGLTQESGFFDYGKITFTSGLNINLSNEIRSFKDGVIELVLPMPFELAINDSFLIEAGCDKTFETCCNRFNNAANFRAEPHVPGIDTILETATTKSDY